MATNNVYCNPNALTDGSGTLLNPYNTYTGKSLTMDDTDYWIFADSVHNGAITIAGAGSSPTSRITLRKYGDGERPIILPNGASKTIRIGTGPVGQGHNVTVKEMDVHGGDHTGAQTNWGIGIGFSAAPADNVEVDDCLVHDVMLRSASAFDHNGINVFGNNFRCTNTEVWDILEDAIWVNSMVADGTGYFYRVHCHDVDQGGLKLGDTLQLLDMPNAIVEQCFLDHSSTAAKQCIVWNQSLGNSGGLVIDSVLIMKLEEGGDYNCVYSNTNGLRIARCLLFGGNTGVYFSAQDQIIESSLVVGAEAGVVGPSSTGVNPTVRNCTIANCVNYGVTVDTAAATVKNNLFIGNGIGLRRRSTATTGNNAYWQNTTARAWLGTAGTDESNPITSNPRIFDLSRDDFRLLPNSPLIGAGDPSMLASVTHDARGRRYRNPPSIGAFEFHVLDKSMWGNKSGRLWLPRGL